MITKLQQNCHFEFWYNKQKQNIFGDEKKIKYKSLIYSCGLCGARWVWLICLIGSEKKEKKKKEIEKKKKINLKFKCNGDVVYVAYESVNPLREDPDLSQNFTVKFEIVLFTDQKNNKIGFVTDTRRVRVDNNLF
ncbi:hypothetical protein BpHYR1_007457 [Brachionus plicatilis]|uniref:Uncharacterized protein n=1 Tax=Brachionus plicatilis TaxID=10195 RepID=A0A3M7Q5X0_BRAPC|nr:hypothetical protein BpHYR1_007457 [Brachionus plicatilis]